MEYIDFNIGWKFKSGNFPQKKVTLPHDAMISESRDKNAPSGSAGAYFNGGVYEYEKSFFVSEQWQGKAISLLFEGVYNKSTVYINGVEVGGCVNGYRSYYVGIKDNLIYNNENVIKVVAKNDEQPNSRWYTGSGIYRPVWLVLGNQEHIDFYGVKITTIDYHTGKVNIHTTHNGGDRVEIEIFQQNSLITKAKGANVDIEIPSFKLWDEHNPFLYQCKVKLFAANEVVDEVVETFGIRKIEWSNKGLFVNGVNTLLRGGCIHHDNGILGAISLKESEERRVKILKDAGFNALRVSHNPTSQSFLDACDKYGIYVMDETWDMWYKRKSKFDYANDFQENYVKDIDFLANRGYNHPSIIMYSIGNEISEPGEKKGIEMTGTLVNEFHKRDTTRPVTAGMNLMIIKNASKGKHMYKEDGGLTAGGKDLSGMNSTMFNFVTSMVGTSMNKMANSKKSDLATSPSLDLLDIAGYNYASGRYPLEGKAHPNRIVVGSETFPQDIVKNWEMVKKYPYLIGDFMWTAWDYLGEVGLGAWAYTNDGKSFNKPYPWLLAEAGIFDILGNPTGEVYLAQAAWGLLDKPIISVRPINHNGKKPAKSVWRGTNSIPSWSWKGCEGEKAIVEVYCVDDYVELQLNGKSLGKKRVKERKAIFKVKYLPGTLTAISFNNSKNTQSCTELKSAQDDLSIQITSEYENINVGDVVYLDICIADKNGIVESNADTKLTIQVDNAELLAFGSANPRTEETYTTGTFTTYYGKAQAVIRFLEKDAVKIKISANGLENTTFCLK